MKYYKIVYGYGLDEYLPITEQELHKAIVLFLEGKGSRYYADSGRLAQSSGLE